MFSYISFSVSKYYFDTPARFRVPQVMTNTLLKMAENFRFAEIWVDRTQKGKKILSTIAKCKVFSQTATMRCISNN